MKTLTKFAKTAPKSTKRKKTTTGRAELTSLTGAVKFGGAAASEAQTSLAANSVNTSRKKKREIRTTRRTERSSEKKKCETCVVNAANNLVTGSMIALTTQTLKR